MEKKIICVTGPIAAGKNHFCSLLKERGFFCIDADTVIHRIITEKGAEILAAFSAEAAAAKIQLQAPDKSLDRRALGRLLFGRPHLLARQEKILYPEFEKRVIKIMEEQAGQADLRGFVINAALLYKTPALLKRCTKIIYIDAPLIVRAVRVHRRDALPWRQIFFRIKSQRGLYKAFKKAAADSGIEFARVWNVGKSAGRHVMLRP